MEIREAARDVARFYQGEGASPHAVAVTSGAILDVLHQGQRPDFIATVCTGEAAGPSRRVMRDLAPWLLDLCGLTLERWRA